MGIPREEALQMTSLEVRKLLLAHEFVLEEEKKKLAREKTKQLPKEGLITR